MKKIWLAVLLACTAFLLHGGESLDYANPDNWILCEKEKTGSKYDLFYLYPTLSSDKTQTFLNFSDQAVMKKVTDFVMAQTGIFAADARIFAPKVRQLEYHAILEYMRHPDEKEWRARFMCGVCDAENAFRFYREKMQKGRPFILLGHSQGAMELYELLKRDRGISGENGFVAAYLPGLPKVTEEQIRTDFRDRGIAPAQSADDLAVIIIWNTQNKEAENSMFTVKNGFCINPLNWKTDGTPASPQEHKGAFFYDYRDNTTKTVPHFCGACADRADGALIVELPSGSEWDAKGFMGKGVFHMNDIWFFAENLKENMLLRTGKYQQKKVQGPPAFSEVP